ncbi:MAG: hypothetical protein HW380_33 [Magnetococcales bacterium]|nr:hypothetical protein [Magnetococcales bacterium]HIJ82839.1 PilZ domain-containing protein [Magnetococcales bacterium]
MGPSQPVTNRREHERSWYRVGCTFTLKSGEIVTGQSFDISFRGIGMSGFSSTQCRIGIQGVLRLDIPGIKDRAFACEVAHVSQRGVGLRVLDARENFGHAVTQAVFGEMSSRIGIEGSEWSDCEVSIRKTGGGQVRAKIVKMNAKNGDFSLLSVGGGGPELNRGDRVDLTIRHRRSGEVNVAGTLADYSVPGFGGNSTNKEKIIRIIFGSSSSVGSGGLEGLIRMIQEKRLSNIMASRTAANSLLSEDRAWHRPDRKDIKRDLERFLSSRKK